MDEINVYGVSVYLNTDATKVGLTYVAAHTEQVAKSVIHHKYPGVTIRSLSCVTRDKTNLGLEVDGFIDNVYQKCVTTGYIDCGLLGVGFTLDYIRAVVIRCDFVPCNPRQEKINTLIS